MTGGADRLRTQSTNEITMLLVVRRETTMNKHLATTPRKSRMRIAVGASLAGVLLLAGCTQAPEARQARSDPFVHVHGLAVEPGSDEILVATHEGIYVVTEGGDVEGPLGGYDFDAMGFTITDEAWFASGHPGPGTPAELGSPNLGILRSEDRGQTWDPITFTGVEDFHVLDSDPSGALYGIGSSSFAVRVSTDRGATWVDRTEVKAASLAASTGRLYAATEQGVQVSTDEGVTFELLPDAPVLYSLTALPGGGLLGVGTDSMLWRSLPEGLWEVIEPVEGMVQALTTADSGAIFLVDDRGIVRIDATGSTIIRPAN